jgi:predicted NBD/HSP70 family sugar kinase
VPFALNPDGAYSIGLKIGRRSTDLVLVDFLGTTRKRIRATHRYPEPAKLLVFLRKGLATLQKEIAGIPHRRVAGLGIATPFELWNWQREAGAPASAMKAWRNFDTQAEVAALCSFPVHLCNDGTAACAAECFFGGNERFRDFLYVFIGSFVGGGVVLNGNVVQGRTGNAGAIGSMPIAEIDDGGVATTRQLIRCASLYTLERRLEDAGVDSSRLWTSSEIWPDFGDALDDWVREAAASLAVLAASAASIIDFEAVVIDGAFPAVVRSRIVAATRKSHAGLDLQGLSPLEIVEGTIGPDARAIGGAALPLIADFARDREVLFRESTVA